LSEFNWNPNFFCSNGTEVRPKSCFFIVGWVRSGQVIRTSFIQVNVSVSLIRSNVLLTEGIRTSVSFLTWVPFKQLLFGLQSIRSSYYFGRLMFGLHGFSHRAFGQSVFQIIDIIGRPTASNTDLKLESGGTSNAGPCRSASETKVLYISTRKLCFFLPLLIR
jgi:hypothetical protein